MEAVARAIAEPRRRAILRLVRDRELSAGEIALHFDVTRPAVSQHVERPARRRACCASGATGRGASTGPVPRAWPSCAPSSTNSGRPGWSA